MDRRNCQKVHTPHTQGYPLCPPTCCQKPLASYQCGSWAVSRNGHGIQSKDWKMLTAKGWLSANVFSDVNPGELICENKRTLIHIWGCGGCLDCWLWGMTLSFLIFHCGFVLVCMCVFLCTGFFSLQQCGRDEDEWDAADKGVVVYLENSCRSLEPFYLFSRVSMRVCNLPNVCKKLYVFFLVECAWLNQHLLLVPQNQNG